MARMLCLRIDASKTKLYNACGVLLKGISQAALYTVLCMCENILDFKTIGDTGNPKDA